jgi:hypothetical protein
MPATTIYYFSATGNSLMVARAIAEKLGDTKLVPMASPDAANPSPNTPRVGLVFPVYIFGLPLISPGSSRNSKFQPMPTCSRWRRTEAWPVPH